jgi:hypothetical protein
MEINAHIISGLDPGAIPGGSTNTSRVIAGEHGADQHRQTSKGVSFLSALPTVSGFKLTANDNFAEEIRLAA